ncbi:unnamed protein product [Vicia faba]|uniref:Uncharacterized protein n=1 Tax=Vicia faba TaxID=3906 RepID=A0AAV0YZP5_VICFA|nr:unnamed protein product [Vicia faba]
MFVPASILGSSSNRNRNNVGSQDVDYDNEELQSSDHEDSDNEKQLKPKYEKFRGELLNKDFQFKLDNVLPIPRKRLDKDILMSGEWMPTWSMDELWKVYHPYNGLQFVVDLGKKVVHVAFGT